MAPIHRKIIGSLPAATKATRRAKSQWNHILVLIAMAAIGASWLLMWHQTRALASLQLQYEMLKASSSEKIMSSSSPEPIRFISVVGLFHSGTTTMWDSIQSNIGVAEEKGIKLQAYSTRNGGYPPCDVPLLSDSTVDMNAAMGNSSGTTEPNTQLFAQYGTMWGDWHKGGPHSKQGLLNMAPPHERDEFFTLWKHTPPQHPVLTCFRSDTLYVIMVRHPKIWHRSMNKKLYDFKFDSQKSLWALYRNIPRRMPPLEIYFRSLYHAWAFYMKGYLSWEQLSAGKTCYAHSYADNRKNCLGGSNEVPNGKRNILIVRYEDYLMNPRTVLARVFSFATRGRINAKTDENKFVPYEKDKIESIKGTLKETKASGFFSVKSSELEGANEITTICSALGYSCDESSDLFIE